MYTIKSFIALKSMVLLFGAFFSYQAISQDLSSIDIPYQKHVLGNGLTLLVHEDHTSPQVFVSVYYRVGSRDESPGKTGFAHLFEHLMFNGSENHPEGFHTPIQDVGGSMNGDTWFDRTRYYQTAPNSALERILWLESDRMGHLVGAITQEKLDQQRGVVQNEKRRGDNRPYAMSKYNMLEGLFPVGHPYRWETIGSMADLSAASLDDVHSWFKEYYGAANALLIVAGDVDSAEVVKAVERNFGDIPEGPVVSRLDDWVPERKSNTREVMQDRAANPAIMRSWVAPGRDHAEFEHLSIASQILGGDESSRLYKALVQDAAVATSVRFIPRGHDLASMPLLNVRLLPDADPDVVEDIINREMARFVREGPTKKELSLAKTSYMANKVRSLDSLRDRAALLVESEFYLGHPDAYREQFKAYEQATADDVQSSAAKWLDDGYHQISIIPFGGHTVATQGADRSKLPDVLDYPDAKAPRISNHTLENGIKVRFVERPGTPAINIAARFGGGYSLEGLQGAGVPTLTLKMLEKGTKRRDAQRIQQDLKVTGSLLDTSIGNDDTVLTLSALSANLQEAVDVLADVVRNPVFEAAELEVQKTVELASIETAKSSPSELVRRYLKWQAYGEAHAYGAKPADAETIRAIGKDDLVAFHKRVYRPENLTIFAVGNVEKDDLVSMLEKQFGNWRPDGTIFSRSVETDSIASRHPRIILFDTPDAPQSNLIAYQLIPPPYGEHHDAFQMANAVFGWGIDSRINGNLRQEKGWSYGVRSATNKAIGPRIWSITAQVQTDKTAASIVELQTELAAITGEQPITQSELNNVRNLTVRSLAGRLATASQIQDYVMGMTVNELPDDFIETRKMALTQLELADLQFSFDEYIDGQSLVWIIAGDLTKIESEIRTLGLGEVEVWNAEGKKLR